MANLSDEQKRKLNARFASPLHIPMHEIRKRIPDGITVKMTLSEYIVNFKGGSQATAYFTSDSQDAIDTAVAMSKERPARATCGICGYRNGDDHNSSEHAFISQLDYEAMKQDMRAKGQLG